MLKARVHRIVHILALFIAYIVHNVLPDGNTSLNLVLFVLAVYPEPVYEVERKLTPRQQRQEITRLRKANHYRIM